MHNNRNPVDSNERRIRAGEPVPLNPLIMSKIITVRAPFRVFRHVFICEKQHRLWVRNGLEIPLKDGYIVSSRIFLELFRCQSYEDIGFLLARADQTR